MNWILNDKEATQSADDDNDLYKFRGNIDVNQI